MKKQEARLTALKAREAAYADPAASARANDWLATMLAHHAGQRLAFYMPIRTEIDPRPAVETHDGPLCLPVVRHSGEPLVFRHWQPGAEMVQGEFGIQVPASALEMRPEVIIVPMLAFDRRGYRLGYGGGFYDRTLEALRAQGPVTAIGFAFSAQEMPHVPTEPTDQKLDLIVTDIGILQP